MKQSLIILSNSSEFIANASEALQKVYKNTYKIIVCHGCNEATVHSISNPGAIVLVDTVYSNLFYNDLYAEINYNFVHCIAVCKNKDSVIEQLKAGAEDFLTFPFRMKTLIKTLKNYIRAVLKIPIFFETLFIA